MVTEIIVTEALWCDRHLHKFDDHVEATISRVITLVEGTKPRQFDTCATCDQEMTLAELSENIGEWGSDPVKVHRQRAKAVKAGRTPTGRPKQSRAPEEPTPCPVPDCDYVAATGGGLSAHLKRHTEAEQRRARVKLARTRKSFKAAV